MAAKPVPSGKWELEPMSESRRRSLNKILPQLETKLIVENIKSTLHTDAGGFLNDVEIIAVFSKSSPLEHVRALIDTLKGKDNAAFGSFCLVLDNSGYGHWSKALMDEAGLDHGFRATPQVALAKAHDIICERRRMFRPQFVKLRSKFNDFRDDIIEVVESLEPKEFIKFADKFAFNLPYIKKNLKLQSADLENSTKLFRALLHNNLYSIFDVAVFEEMSKCLPKARKELKDRVVENLQDYKECKLQPVLERTMSELAKDADVVYTHNDCQEHINLAFVYPEDPTFDKLLEAKEYLEDMNIRNVSNLRVDYGCVIVVFTITYPLEDLGDLAGKLSSEHHRQKLKQFGISRVFLLGHWGMEVDDGAVCHFKEASPHTERLSSVVIEDKLTLPGFEEEKRRVRKKFPDFSLVFEAIFEQYCYYRKHCVREKRRNSTLKREIILLRSQKTPEEGRRQEIVPHQVKTAEESSNSNLELHQRGQRTFHSMHEGLERLKEFSGNLESDDYRFEPLMKLDLQSLLPYMEELAPEGLAISRFLGRSAEWQSEEKTFQSPRDRLQALLDEWLKDSYDEDYPQDWEFFIDVVEKCGKTQLANTIHRAVFGADDQ